MSQIGLSQLCRGLALSALLVQGYWNCFDLASPSWIETTRKLNCCRKRLKILLVPSAKCTSYSPSPHPILSLTLYISPILSLISCSITFYTSSTLPPLSFYLSLFLYYSKSPPQWATCGELSPNVSKRTWYQVNRSASSRESQSVPLAPAGWVCVCCGWTKGEDILVFLRCNTDLRMPPGWYSICALLNIVLLCKNLGQRTATLGKYFVYRS